MSHLAVIQLKHVINWPRSDSDGSCVNKNVRDNKGFYSNRFCQVSVEQVGLASPRTVNRVTN